MDRKSLDEAKEFLTKVRQSETANALVKRAALVAVVLGFIKTTAAVAEQSHTDKLVNSLERSNALPMTHTWKNWHDWKDWKDWKDWSNWKDWKNWNDWKDWKNWNDWKDWKNWNDWRDWKNAHWKL